MTLSRFERKLLVALVAVAVMPMLGALFLGQAALREAFEVGVNARVAGQLQSGLSLFRTHLQALRQDAENVATAIANDQALHAALAGGDREQLHARLEALRALYPNVFVIRLVDGEGRAMAETEAPALDPDRQRPLRLERRLQLDGVAVQVTLFAPVQLFADYQRAGELAEVFGRLETGRGTVSNYYLLVYMGFLLAVIAVAITVGIVLSRRVTRRIALLADATAEVGAGNLDVQVPTDVTDEIGELTRAFNAMVRDIRESRGRIEFLQRLGAWQDFARRLAHEIKNPLTPIQLAVQEIHRGYRGEDARFRGQLDDTLAIVEEEVATLRRLVSEFSDFARMPEAQLDDSTLQEFLDESARSLQALAEEYSYPDGTPVATITCHVPRTPLAVRIDGMMLRRALDNLVRNALQALRDAGAHGHIDVSAVLMDDQAVLRVTDDGPGVPEHERQRIFDPYVTTKSDGTGLGLAITKKIVFEHEGEINCGPGVEGGATFEIRLPLRG